jgi:hypothetical protein
MSLSERRRNDIPFIGGDIHDDMYYLTDSGKYFDMTEEPFYPDFESWYSALHGFVVRSEMIVEDVRECDTAAVKGWLEMAFAAGYQLGYETACAKYQREDDV